jgi:hypothetical protein
MTRISEENTTVHPVKRAQVAGELREEHRITAVKTTAAACGARRDAACGARHLVVGDVLPLPEERLLLDEPCKVTC